MKVLLKNGYLVDPSASAVPELPVSVLLEDGRIAAVGAGLDAGDAEVYDCTGLYIMPGVIDAHTHIGYGSERDLETETKNAVSGGVTSLITYHRKAENYLETVPAFIDKINREAFCNVGIHLGLSTYEQTDQLATYVNEFKIPSFKYFTNYIGAAGVKAGVEIVSDANLIEWMTRIARLGGTLCIHAENQDVIEKRTAIVKAKGEDNLQGWYEARPPICEAEAILRCAYFAAKTGCRFYAVHVTCAESLEVLRMMKRQYPDAQIIVETCPHYLLLDDACLQEDGRFKMNPPLRDKSDREALLEGLADGTIDMIATDHAPHSAEEKGRGLEKSAMGVVGLETAFPLLYTELVEPGVISMERLMELLHDAPCRRFNIPTDTGFTVFDLNDTYRIDPADFLSMGKATPFTGWEVQGRCLLTATGEGAVWCDEERLLRGERL